MRKCGLATMLVAATLFLAVETRAQQQAAPSPLDTVPGKMPFDVPYGAPISLERAQAVIAAAVAEAQKRDWKLNFAVVDFGRQSRRLRAHGRRDARLDHDRPA